MQSGVDVGAGAGAGEDMDVDEDNIPGADTSATSLVTPGPERVRRRVSGIHISRTLVRYIYLPLSTPTERTVRTEVLNSSPLTSVLLAWGVLAFNIQWLAYCRMERCISHLPFILCHPAAPLPIRWKATLVLSDILAIVPRHLAAVPSDLQATVQRHVLTVLAQLGGLTSSASMELLRLGLETLH